MRKFILASLVVFATLSVFIACKKDGNDPTKENPTPNTPAKSVTDMLTGGNIRKWQIVSRSINGKPMTLDTCYMESRMVFIKAGNKFIMDEGTSCHAPNEFGTWALSNNDKTLTLNFQFAIEASDTVIESGQNLLDIITLSDA